MLILVLIDGQYSQKAVLSLVKTSNCHNHTSSGSANPVKKITLPQVKFLIPACWGRIYPPLPLPLTAIWKALLLNMGMFKIKSN